MDLTLFCYCKRTVNPFHFPETRPGFWHRTEILSRCHIASHGVGELLWMLSSSAGITLFNVQLCQLYHALTCNQWSHDDNSKSQACHGCPRQLVVTACHENLLFSQTHVWLNSSLWSVSHRCSFKMKAVFTALNELIISCTSLSIVHFTFISFNIYFTANEGEYHRTRSSAKMV